MKHRFNELVDIEKVNLLIQNFYDLSGIPTAITEPDGTFFYLKDGAPLGAGFKRICMEFHRVHPKSFQLCKECVANLFKKMTNAKEYACYECMNGLVDVAVPINMEGKHVATLFQGQFLFESPDIASFRERAITFGFDEIKYLKALSEVPIFSREKINQGISFMIDLSELLMDMGATRRELLDLTENLEQRVQIRTTELHRFEYIVSSSSDMMALIDKNFTYLAVNNAFVDAFGKTRDEIVGHNVIEIFGEESFEKVIRTNAEHCLSGEQINYENWFTFPVSGRQYMNISYFPYLDEANKVTGYVVVARNLSDRKKAEDEKDILEAQIKQATKMQAVGTLAGGIAHEFNNLIGIIMGSTEVALEAVSNDNYAKRQLDRIIKASLNAKGLVKQILTFSRKSDHKVFPLSPYTVVKESLKLMGPSIPSSVEIHKNLSADCNDILVDPTEIQQILMNICFNAVHAMKEKGVLEISLEPIKLRDKETKMIANVQAGQYVRLSVSDTGKGMDAETRERIFDPFFTTKEVGQGTGMGLALVYGIMESYGGTVTCDSAIEEGTTFHLYFPVTEKVLPEKVGKLGQLPLGTEHILLVDDEEMFAEMGRDLLESLGYRVTMMTDSNEALKVFQEEPDKFDLVITDQVMPDVSGEELCRGILNIKPQMPIILCTGFSTQMDEKKAKRIGIREYAMKPQRFRNDLKYL